MRIKHWLTCTAIVSTACGTAMAQAQQARVLSSIPVSQQVPAPQQVCEDTQVQSGARTNGTGALIGAIIGGVAGNAMGHGSYRGHRGHYYPSTRGPSTVVGAIAGGLIGNAVESANSPPSYESVRRCTNTTGYEMRVVGYDVTYEYAGQRYATRLDYDPGQWLPVHVQPQPTYSNTTSATAQFIGPSGVYQAAPASIVITDSRVNAQPAAAAIGVHVGSYPAPPHSSHYGPSPAYYWR